MRIRPPGLRMLFVGLIFAGLVPVTALTVKTSFDQRESARARVMEEAARLGRLAALREADLVDGARDVLAAVAQFPSALGESGADCSTRLAALLTLYPRFANLGIVQPDGTLYCAARVPPTSLNFSDRAWFRRAIATKAFSVGDYQIGRITGRPSLVLGLPIIDAGQVSAVAWAALDLNWLQQFAASLRLPSDPVVAVIDRQGTVLARHPDPQRWVGRSVPVLAEAIQRDGAYTTETSGLDDVRRLYSVTALGDSAAPHALVSVGLETSSVYADANAQLRRNLAVLAVVALLGLVGSRFAADRLILRPTRSLLRVSSGLAAGDLAARVRPPYAAGELGQVSRAFDTMASALQIRDSELERAIDDRRRSEARFAALLEAAPDAIVGIGPEGSIQLVNRQAETLFGWPRDELLGRPVEVVAPDVVATLGLRFGPDASAGCLRPPGGTLAVSGRTKDGRDFPAEVTLATLETDQGVLVCAAVRDVTDREFAEEKIRRGREQLQAVLDNAPAVIYMKDTEGRYVLVNREFEAVNGLERQDVIGRTAHEIFDPEWSDAIHKADMAVLSTLVPIESEETAVLPDGPHTYFSLRFPLLDKSGVAYAACAISTDITERMHTEAERKRLEAKLHQVERLESLGQLAGGVAHDFNNLLAVMLNYADFVLDAVADPPAGYEDVFAGIMADVASIRRAGERAAALTRQLLIFGRRDTVQPRVLVLNEVIEGLEPLLQRAVGEDIAVEVDVPTHPWPVYADPGRIEQVLMNLSVNARDAMERGGTLSITAENLEVSDAMAASSGLPPGRYVRLVVSDTGSGMTPEVAARAFEPFFTTKQKGQGTGLGLATVFGVVSDAGGTVALESVVGTGTTVLINLPARLDVPAVDDGPTDDRPLLGRAATVLVVEDEDDVREVARRILAGAGYDVLAAADAFEALQTCEDHDGPIHLLVTDVVMPGCSGPEMVERARRLRPEIRAVYMSGYPEDFLARRHSVTTTGEVISKPFTATALLRTVRAALTAV